MTIRLSKGCYTVGWICALQSELTAAMSMLDERHERPPQAPGDTNTYILGCVAGHDVVIACLPEMGTTPAARVAKQMSTTFPDLRFGLLVGIGGGIPSNGHDIRLGDVVVGTLGEKNGAVVQWDYGKTVEDGEFVHYGSLNAPPAVLCTAVNTLRAEHNLKNSRLELYLRQGYSLLSTSATLEYRRPSAENDVLFEADYDCSSNPVGQSTRRECDACDRKRIAPRSPRKDQTVIHYGTIASGNQVIKHGITRDKIGKKFDALCFEMEAAGIVDDFPCVVIRGICDYADSHKNKIWQGHAAMVAAAFAKELLRIIPTSQVNEEFDPGSFSPCSIPSVKIGKSNLRTWCNEERRSYWQDYWHEDRGIKRRRPNDYGHGGVEPREIHELEGQLTGPARSGARASISRTLQGSLVASTDETMATKLSGFMHDYHSELLLQLADFPHPDQQRGLFGAMLRLTKSQLNEDGDIGRTLLHWLAMNGESNLLPKLVELGFGVNDKDSDIKRRNQTEADFASYCTRATMRI